MFVSCRTDVCSIQECAAGGLLLACGVTEEGRRDVMVVKPEDMMMDGADGCRSTSLISSFENCCVVLVGWKMDALEWVDSSSLRYHPS